MDLSDLDKVSKAARELPHLLVRIPDEELTSEVIASVTNDLQAQLNDNHIAEKLGRAFMLGRLHRFMGVQLANTPPLDTVDECNLYAGGYQYDLKGDEHNPVLDALIMSEQEAERDRIVRFEESLETFRMMVERYRQDGPSLELVENMMALRLDMQALTTANLISRVKIMEARAVNSYAELGRIITRSDELNDKLSELLEQP